MVTLVGPRPTTAQLKRAAKATTNASPEPVTKGKPITATGKVIRANWSTKKYDAYSGRTVSLQFRPKETDSYKTLKKATTSSTGALKTTVTASVDGYYRWVYYGQHHDRRRHQRGWLRRRTLTPFTRLLFKWGDAVERSRCFVPLPRAVTSCRPPHAVTPFRCPVPLPRSIPPDERPGAATGVNITTVFSAMRGTKNAQRGERNAEKRRGRR